MSKPKNQHWVPQFYLRYFSTPETIEKKYPQVWIISKLEEDGDEKLTSVKKVCGKNYIYTPKTKNGDRNWHLENKFGSTEFTISLLWDRLANNFADLSDKTIRKGVSLFIALTYLRNPEIRRQIEERYNQLVNFYKSIPADESGIPLIDTIRVKGVAYKFDTGDWHEYKSRDKNGHDQSFTQLIQSEAVKIAEILMQKRWSIIFSETDAFVTSDKPVILVHPSIKNFGFDTKGVVVSFPLSPKRLIVMDDLFNEPANQYYPLLKSNLGCYNLLIWNNINRFLITGRSISEVLSEIQPFLDKS